MAGKSPSGDISSTFRQPTARVNRVPWGLRYMIFIGFGRIGLRRVVERGPWGPGGPGGGQNLFGSASGLRAAMHMLERFVIIRYSHSSKATLRDRTITAPSLRLISVESRSEQASKERNSSVQDPTKRLQMPMMQSIADDATVSPRSKNILNEMQGETGRARSLDLARSLNISLPNSDCDTAVKLNSAPRNRHLHVSKLLR